MTIINNALTQAQEVTIDTVVTQSLKLGEIPVKADRRSTTEKPVPEDQRIRRVVLPSGHWGTLSVSINGEVSQGLTDVLTAGLRKIADERLKEWLSEQPLARTVALADYTVAALLSWNAETAAARGALTVSKEEVEKWYATSKLQAKMAAIGKPAIELLAKRTAALAAKNHGLASEDEANKLITLLADDADNSVAAELIQRCTHIAKQFQAKKAEKTFSLADLT
jgi:predicted transcriptional regulator